MRTLLKITLIGIFVGLVSNGPEVRAQIATPPPAITTPANTSDDPAAVAEMLFAAMREKSADKIRALFLPEGRLVAIDKPKDGHGLSKTRLFTPDAFATAIAGGQGDFRELMPKKTVEVTGDLALVWGRYTFYLGDKFSHCGTNAFHLVRTEAGWKIADIASTLEFQCDGEAKKP
jgi:hypothetical protein